MNIKNSDLGIYINIKCEKRNSKYRKDDNTLDNFSIYCHTNKINGKKYIGLTSIAPEKRWGSNGANYGKSSRYMYNAIKKYGWDNFEHEILKTGLTEKEAKKYESYYIKQYNTLAPFGYNLTGGGEYPDIISEETKLKMRESHLSVKLSEETRLNMSKARTGHTGYNCKSVWQCDKKTHQKIKKFDSTLEAGRALGNEKYYAHIGHVYRGERASAYGFFWEYEKEE